MERAIGINNLCIGYKGKGDTKVVCSNLNASLNSGTLTCLIGVNGSGKSTLLRTLSGFLQPISGHIDIFGHDITSISNRQRSRTVGIVLTERPEIQQFTAREMVSLGRSPYTGYFDKLSKEDNNIIDESINMVGIKEIENRLVDTLSDGERQKVMIAKVIAQQTPIILLDEPTAFLDYPSKIEILDLLTILAHKLDKTIILSTHDLGTSLEKVDNIWLITDDGQLKAGNLTDFGLKFPISPEQILNLFLNKEH